MKRLAAAVFVLVCLAATPGGRATHRQLPLIFCFRDGSCVATCADDLPLWLRLRGAPVILDGTALPRVDPVPAAASPKKRPPLQEVRLLKPECLTPGPIIIVRPLGR